MFVLVTNSTHPENHVIGPFDSREAASAWAHYHLVGCCWQVRLVQTPAR